jgi:hypothetical protein
VLICQIFGGLLAYGIAVGSRKHGAILEPWKIVFLVTGLLTASIGIVFLWAVPDNQLNCRWLSKEDRILALERIRINGQGVGNKHFKFYQLKEALLDPLSWAFFFYALIADIPNGKYPRLSCKETTLTQVQEAYQTSSPNSSSASATPPSNLFSTARPAAPSKSSFSLLAAGLATGKR